jgi:serine/threonine protein kinase
MSTGRADEERTHGKTVHGGSLFMQANRGILPAWSAAEAPRQEEEFAPLVQPADGNARGAGSSSVREPASTDVIRALLPESPNKAVSSTLRALWSASSDSLSGGPKSWTVHDGNFFAAAIKMDQPHTPNERRLVDFLHGSEAFERGLEPERVTWHKRPKRLRSSGPGADTPPIPEVVSDDPRCVAVLEPAPVSSLGGEVLDMDAFTLEGCIGMGQFASVHRARRKGDGLRVALKLWHRPVALSRPGSPPGRPSAADRPQCDIEDVACFEQEVAMLKTCVAQPIEGLVKFVGYGFFSEDKLPEVRGFIVMELINGQDLRRVQARGEHEISAARIARWARQLASTLAALHARGIVHRDLKESNIMLSADDRVILVDLGLAIRLPTPSPGQPLTATTVYQSAQRVGVLGYMAPEVHRKRAYGAPVDVFAYGVVLRKLLGRTRPPPRKGFLQSACFPLLYGLTKSSYAYEVIYCSPTVHSAWPAALSELVVDCCALDPDARPSFKEILRRLAAYAPARA